MSIHSCDCRHSCSRRRSSEDIAALRSKVSLGVKVIPPSSPGVQIQSAFGIDVNDFPYLLFTSTFVDDDKIINVRFNHGVAILIQTRKCTMTRGVQFFVGDIEVDHRTRTRDVSEMFLNHFDAVGQHGHRGTVLQ